MNIVLYEHPTLRTKSTEVDVVDDEIREILDEMVETTGVGLAANQVDIPKRFFVLEVENKVKKIVNPEIIESSDEIIEYEEGCLSIPGIYKKVNRPSEIKVKYLNEKGEEVIEELKEMWARAFQHELDHLDGVLFIDRISVLNKRLISKKLDLMKKEFAKGKKYREE